MNNKVDTLMLQSSRAALRHALTMRRKCHRSCSQGYQNALPTYGAAGRVDCAFSRAAYNDEEDVCGVWILNANSITSVGRRVSVRTRMTANKREPEVVVLDEGGTNKTDRKRRRRRGEEGDVAGANRQQVRQLWDCQLFKDRAPPSPSDRRRSLAYFLTAQVLSERSRLYGSTLLPDLISSFDLITKYTL